MTALPPNPAIPLPHDPAAEAAVCSLALYHPETPAEMEVRGFRVEWLHLPEHRAVWRLIARYREKFDEREVDGVRLLSLAMEPDGELNDIGGPAKLTELFGGPGVSNPAILDHYANHLQDAWVKREMHRISEALTRGEDIGELAAQLAAVSEVASKAKARGLVDKLKAALVPASGLNVMEITPRPRLLGSWMREGDLGYIFAPRGVGKSWIAMLIGNAIAEGEAIGEWSAGDGRREVVYFDAEMNLADTQDRSKSLGISRMIWMHNELVYNQIGRFLNIANPDDQRAIEGILPDNSVFIIDNLSTAASGMPENDNDAWDLMKDWLLRLRLRGITVIVIHHAGRNNEMRGGSRREDMSMWIIKLKDATDEGGITTIQSVFTKHRNCRPSEALPLEWQIEVVDGYATIGCKRRTGIDAMLGLVVGGIDTASDLAAALEVSTGCVSKWARKLADEGRIKIDGRRYVPAA